MRGYLFNNDAKFAIGQSKVFPFACYLAALGATLGHCGGSRFSNPMLSTAF